MSEKVIRILVVEDNEAHVELIGRSLDSWPRQVDLKTQSSLAKARVIISDWNPNLVIVDFLLPDGRGTDLLPSEGENLFPVVLMTSHGSEQLAVDAMRAGASDYIVKSPASLADMAMVCARVLREWNHSLRRRKAEADAQELNKELGKRVDERTAELESTQKELVKQAHRAGMADIASSVLHDVGNILNNVITSAEFIKSSLDASKLNSLAMANKLLVKNKERMGEFMNVDPKGEKLLKHYLLTEEKLLQEQRSIWLNADRIMDKVELIRDVIVAQQSYATGGIQSELMLLQDVVEDALKIIEGDIKTHKLYIEKHFHPVPKTVVQRTKLINILVNLLKNAREASLARKVIILTVERDQENAYIKVADMGKGIKADHLKLIFTHGFTTKEHGHGFGLHGCARSMAEMGGNMWAESEGEGKGAIFTLRFPL